MHTHTKKVNKGQIKVKRKGESNVIKKIELKDGAKIEFEQKNLVINWSKYLKVIKLTL